MSAGLSGTTSANLISVFVNFVCSFVRLAGFLTGRPEWLDLALVYVLVNFIGMLALTRFCRFGGFGQDTRRRTW